MLNLNLIEMYCIDGNSSKHDFYKKIISYINKNFKFYKIKYISPKNPNIDGCDYIKINKINSSEEYSKFIITELANYVEADYVLTTHADGFPINPDIWDDEFLKYDFIGAPWPWKPGNDHLGMGKSFNGGFSLRSKKFLNIQKLIQFEYKHIIDNEGKSIVYWHEDAVVTDVTRQLFLKNNCFYAPYEIAKKFSLELNLPNENNSINEVFGFHYQKEQKGKWNHKNKEVNDLLKQIENMKV